MRDTAANMSLLLPRGAAANVTLLSTRALDEMASKAGQEPRPPISDSKAVLPMQYLAKNVSICGVEQGFVRECYAIFT
jgi:hypothetical protein